MPFAGMLTLAMVCAAVVLDLAYGPHNIDGKPVLPRPPWLALILFGFFLGLAVLAKGPAAIILTGGAIFFWALLTKRWRDAFRLLHPAAIAAFCVTALPWYILCARRNPDFFRVFIIEHNFQRYLTPEFQHLQPFWYYVPVILVAFLPWTVFVAGGAAWRAHQLVRIRGLGPITWLVVTMAAFTVLFFTISKSKLPGYVLPAVPAIGFLFARLFSDSRLLPRRFSAALGLPTSIAVVLAVASCSPIVRARNLDAISVKPVARILKSEVPNICTLRVFALRRSEHYGLNFYLHQEVPDWVGHEVRDGYVVTDGKYCDSLKTPDSCEDLWGRRDFVSSGASALLKITPRTSLDRGGVGRQPH